MCSSIVGLRAGAHFLSNRPFTCPLLNCRVEISAWFTPGSRQNGLCGRMARSLGLLAIYRLRSPPPIRSFVSHAFGRWTIFRHKITQQQRYHAVLFSILAGLALLLAAVGLYGLISQAVAQRTREIGVRLALGATPQQVMRAVMKMGISLALAGAVAGLLLSLVAVRSLQHLLFGVRPADPAVLIASIAVLLLITLAAAFVPTARILRLDPAQTLRQQ